MKSDRRLTHVVNRRDPNKIPVCSSRLPAAKSYVGRGGIVSGYENVSVEEIVGGGSASHSLKSATGDHT